ncbi:hypothetical protein ACS0TY_022184 [Phlomoides rotata]
MLTNLVFLMYDKLQQNWKIKRHRLVAAASGNEGFYIDLFDNSLYDLAPVFRPSPMSTIPVEHDTAGMLTNLQWKSCHSLQFEFLGFNSAYNLKKYDESKTCAVSEDSSKEPGKEHVNDDERVREINLTLREVHRAIHDEQVFDLVNREACSPSLHVNLTGIKENYLQLSICQGASISLSLASSGQDDQSVDASDRNNTETSNMSLESSDGDLLKQSSLYAGKSEGEGSPNVLSLFKGTSDSASSINGYECDLADLPIILLQQVASQIIQWLHEEALTVVIKANRDFLALGFELGQGEIVRLVAHVNPDDTQGCISWWLTIDDGLTEEHKLRSDTSNSKSGSRKFLGYLPLDLLYSTLLDFLNLCSY